MNNHYLFVFLFLITISLIQTTDGEIHRAKSSNEHHKNRHKSSYVAKQPVADASRSMEHLDATTYTWIFASLGSILVGLSGIFPLLIIPIESGPALKHGGE